MRNFLLRVCHLWSFTATCGFLFQCRGQPCVRSEQRQGPPGTGQSCSDSPRHPEDHVLRLSRSPPPPHHHLRAFPPGHIHPPSHPGRQVHVVCQPRSPHSCKSCIPPPSRRHTPSEAGPDTVQREAGRNDGEGETKPPHWTQNANAAFENKPETNSALLCNIKPANYSIVHPYRATSPSPPLLASIPFSPVTSFHFIVFLSGVLICSFAISSTSSQFKEWQFALFLFYFFPPLLLPLVYW